MIKIGVIADDFTGATDIASFLVENGLPTVQINGVPTGKMPEAIDALVISLKTRSCPVVEATQQSLAALSWLQQQGCKQIYFKYCSTFDSTAKGNIGPVTDALMDALDTPFTVFSPALPVNGRTVYQGYLFVMNQLLAESGMRHHPVNPMTDSYLPRLVESQSTGRCGVVSAHVFEQGVKAVRQELARLQQEGYRYAVLDALTEHHLEIQGEALRDAPLVTGGSGLAIGLARQWAQENGNQAREAGRPLAGGRGVVLSGSCSQMTMLSNDQPPGGARWHITVKLHQPVRLMWHAASQPKLWHAASQPKLWPLMHTSWQSGFCARKVYLLHLFLPPPALTHWQQFNSNTVHKKPVRQWKHCFFN